MITAEPPKWAPPRSASLAICAGGWPPRRVVFGEPVTIVNPPRTVDDFRSNLRMTTRQSQRQGDAGAGEGPALRVRVRGRRRSAQFRRGHTANLRLDRGVCAAWISMSIYPECLGLIGRTTAGRKSPLTNDQLGLPIPDAAHHSGRREGVRFVNPPTAAAPSISKTVFQDLSLSTIST